MSFLCTLLLGTLISVSSVSWFSAWIGLELNLLSFIPIMISKNNQYSSESALKYFLVQALGSSLIISSALFMLVNLSLSYVGVTCALLMKLGAAPFHFWFPQVMNGLSWPKISLLMTVQKMAPLFLMLYLFSAVDLMLMLYTIIVSSSTMGALGGINQTSLRKIIAYSSINHIGWLMASILVSEKVLIIYFLFYCAISLSIILIFESFQLFHFNQLLNLHAPSATKMLMFFSLLSLGGLPPFSGFIPKWVIIQNLVFYQNIFILTVLLLSALITLYFYLRVSTLSLSMTYSKVKMSTIKSTISTKAMNPFLVFVNFFGLLLPFSISL